MESLEKGTHYNICACARKETTEDGKKTRRYGRALHDTRVSDTRKRLTGLTAQEETNTDTYKEKKYKQKNGREKDTKKQRHSKRTDTGNRRKAADSPENTKQVTTQQTC